MAEISRRDLFKLAPVLAGGAAVALTAKKEADVVTKGMFPSDGVWYQPLYEVHTEGPELPLNPNASGIFMEWNIDHTVFTAQNGEFVRTDFTQYDVPIDRLVESSFDSPGRQAVLEVARQKHIPIGFGDTAISDLSETLSMFEGMSDEKKQQFYGGILLAIGSFIPEATRRVMVRHVGQPMSRRQFLIAGGTTLVGSLGALYGGWLATDTQYFNNLTAGKVTDWSRQRNPYERFLIRLHGFARDVHPNPPLIFTRNLIMALKTKLFASYVKDRGIRNPVVAFNVGGAHAGIEDFIGLPDAALRAMIVHINKEYVAQGTAKYGDSYAAIRIIQADAGGNFQDIKRLTDPRLLELLKQ